MHVWNVAKLHKLHNFLGLSKQIAKGVTNFQLGSEGRIDPLLGSKYFVANSPVPVKRISANIGHVDLSTIFDPGRCEFFSLSCGSLRFL